MTIRPAPGERRVASALLSDAAKDRRQLVRRDHLELRERALVRALVGAPPAKLRRMAEARPLHVIVRDLHDELRTQRLPGQVFPLTPPTDHAGTTMRLGGRLL